MLADPSAPTAAGTWNVREPRGDDLLFVGVLAFATAIATRLVGHPLIRVVGGVVAVLCAGRLVLEALGRPRGVFESLGPIGFVVLVMALGTSSARGRLTAGRR